TARAGMLMRPTRVAAVICHALSPELSHDAYGFTASFLNGARPEGVPGGLRAARGCAAAGARTTPRPSQPRDPGGPAGAEPDRHFGVGQEHLLFPMAGFRTRFPAVTPRGRSCIR